MQIRLSISLVTRNRYSSLERWLKSIRSQTMQPYEIIISDDSDFENKELNRKLAIKYRAIYIDGPQKGLSANRNNAFIYCKGTHILSADDDHTHPIDFIEKIYFKLLEYPENIWIISEKDSEFSNIPLACPAEINYNGLAGCKPENPDNSCAISCGATVYPISLFKLYKLYYPENYTFGNIWYLWGLMLNKVGFQIRFLSSTFVIHNWRDTVETSRGYDAEFIASILEANYFVALCYNREFKKSWQLSIFLFFHSLRLILFRNTLPTYNKSVRLSINRILNAKKHSRDFSLVWRKYLLIIK